MPVVILFVSDLFSSLPGRAEEDDESCLSADQGGGGEVPASVVELAVGLALDGRRKVGLIRYCGCVLCLYSCVVL